MLSRSEGRVGAQTIAERPFVLFVQPSLFDTTRAPSGQHTAWAYCHVPSGSTHSALATIEEEVERFAPGFREIVLARSCRNASAMEAYNPNYVGYHAACSALRRVFGLDPPIELG